MNRLLLSAAVAGLLAGVAVGADLKSGLQSGDKVTPFNPLNVTGPDAGEKRCQI
jgi:hypothetical protein